MTKEPTPAATPATAATPAAAATPDGADPSMEEILASIRRILNDDDVPAAADAPTTAPADDDVLILDESMIVAEPASGAAGAEPAVDVADLEPASDGAEPEPASKPAASEPHADTVAALQPLASPAEAQSLHQETEAVTSISKADARELPAPTSDLVAPEAAAAAATSVGSLVRSLAAGRATQVYGGGPTLEDIVRAELRPLLKEWLDMNLPPMVERLVRAEIERVVGRCVP